jgi:hypothetical protein
VAVAVVVAAAMFSAERAPAVFHASVIDEVMTSYGGDPNVQFIEVRMLASLQSFVSHSVLAAFDSSGNYIADILVMPNNLANSGPDVRWLVGTSALQTASGITPDFIMPAGVLPSGGGMVCFGGGGGLAPQNPPNWDRTAFATYVDCLAYGTYAGPSNVRIGTPTQLNGDGHSLQRSGTTHDNAADFTCADPATPENNAGDTGSLAATTPCSGGEPTPTVTPPPAGACVGDCDGDHMVAIGELIMGVNIALGNAPVSTCPAFDADGNGMVAIGELIQGVNNALNGCPP